METIPSENLSRRLWRWMAPFGPQNVAPTRVAELVGAPQHAVNARKGNKT